MEKYQSVKLFNGFTTTFRQWKADKTHCKYLHGYAISIRVTFEGKLDEKNWVYDFGGLKRSENLIGTKRPKEWLDWLLDHTTLVAQDDPNLDWFQEAQERGIIQLRIVPHTGAERLAEYLYKILNDFIHQETSGRVKIVKVEVLENENNSAIYYE